MSIDVVHTDCYEYVLSQRQVALRRSALFGISSSSPLGGCGGHLSSLLTRWEQGRSQGERGRGDHSRLGGCGEGPQRLTPHAETFYKQISHDKAGAELKEGALRTTHLFLA